MEKLLTFREAGQKLGVERNVLKKMLRDGKLPEAEKIRRSEGWVWVLPDDALEKLGKHPDLVIDVRGAESNASMAIDPQVSNDASSKDVAEVMEPQITPTTNPSSDSGHDANGNSVASIHHLSLASGNKEVSNYKSDNHNNLVRPSAAEIVDMALLDKLLGIQEAKAEAASRAEQAEYALEATKTHYSKLEEELAVERQERSTAAERLREERLARKIADVKIAELNEQLVRETTIAESERKERIAAATRTMDAEKKTSYAVASMNWIARKRFMKAIRRETSDST